MNKCMSLRIQSIKKVAHQIINKCLNSNNNYWLQKPIMIVGIVIGIHKKLMCSMMAIRVKMGKVQVLMERKLLKTQLVIITTLGLVLLTEQAIKSLLIIIWPIIKNQRAAHQTLRQSQWIQNLLEKEHKVIEVIIERVACK